MQTLRGAVWLQLQILRADCTYLNEVLATPFFAVIFLGIVRQAGRGDLTSHALVAPVLITLWAMSLDISGDIVDSDRWMGVLEPVIATPSSFSTVVLGRVLAVSVLATVGLAETWLVAAVGFGVDVQLHHPWLFGATLVATSVATSGTALLMAATFVLARSARTFQNTLNYPFYLLAGVLVPLSFLPFWLRPVGRLVFLSWSAELLRDALEPAVVADVPLRLGMVLGLGMAGYFAGRMVLHRVLWRVRSLGTIAHL